MLCFFKRINDLDKALRMYEDCLDIRKEIGNKNGIANSLNNIASIHYKNKNFLFALENFLKSQALNNQMGIKGEETYKNISEIRSIQGLTKFKRLANDAINNCFASELKPFIDIEEFVEDNTVRHYRKA